MKTTQKTQTCHAELVSASNSNKTLKRVQGDKRAAFTLAEILITLAIIGIVAAMTIPTLISKYEKKVTVTRLQKSYSTLAQAVTYSIMDNGMPSTWDLMDPETILKENIGKYIKVSKYYPVNNQHIPLCHEKQVTNYDNEYTYGWLNKIHIVAPFDSKNASLLTSDGVCIGISNNTTYGTSGVVFIDINSSINGPNLAGKDLFIFYFDEKGSLVPYGYDFSDYQLLNAITGCNNKTGGGGSGTACAAKIIRDGWQIKDDYPW